MPSPLRHDRCFCGSQSNPEREPRVKLPLCSSGLTHSAASRPDHPYLADCRAQPWSWPARDTEPQPQWKPQMDLRDAESLLLCPEKSLLAGIIDAKGQANLELSEAILPAPCPWREPIWNEVRRGPQNRKIRERKEDPLSVPPPLTLY